MTLADIEAELGYPVKVVSEWLISNKIFILKLAQYSSNMK
jgi:hypothetical protein